MWTLPNFKGLARKKKRYFTVSFCVEYLQCVNQCWSYVKSFTLISSEVVSQTMWTFMSKYKECLLPLSELTLK